MKVIRFFGYNSPRAINLKNIGLIDMDQCDPGRLLM